MPAPHRLSSNLTVSHLSCPALYLDVRDGHMPSDQLLLQARILIDLTSASSSSCWSLLTSVGLPYQQQLPRRGDHFKRQLAPSRAPLLPSSHQSLIVLRSFHPGGSPCRASPAEPTFPTSPSFHPSPPRPLHSSHPFSRPHRNHRGLHNCHGRRLPCQEGKVQEVEGAPALRSEHSN